jgi:hypothetical protein
LDSQPLDVLPSQSFQPVAQFVISQLPKALQA